MEDLEGQLTSLKDLRLSSQRKQSEFEDGKRKSRKLQKIKKQAQDKKIYENFSIKNKVKSKLDKEIILKSLSSHFIFSSLIREKAVQDTLIEKFNLCKVNKGQYLLKQDDNASSFFILHEGKLEVEINGVSKRTINAGEGFGQLALLYSAPRSASIRAIQSSFLWFIDRSTFRTAIQTIIEKTFKQNRQFIGSNKFFKILTPDQKDKIASIAITQKYEKNSKLVKEGQLASSMFILKSGKLRREVKGKEVDTILPGDSFDQYAIQSKNCVRKETITVLQESQVIALATQDIESTLGNCLSFIVLRNKVRQALIESELFTEIQPEQLERVIDTVKLTKVKKGDKPILEGQLYRDKITLIIEGQHQFKGEKPSKTLLGIKSLKEQYKEEKFKFDLIFHSDGMIAQFSTESFKENFGMSYQNLISKGKQFKKILEKQQGERVDIKSEVNKLELTDFYELKKLGQGQFGVVHLVTDPKRERLFALKCISKSETIKAKLEKHLLNEKQVLVNVNSPFVMGYFRSFKDANFIYFLTEFINGVELFDAIRMIGLLNAKQSRFYGALMLLALESLHAKNIVYRDLKPENAMIDADGYLKLIDMGACKRISKTSASQKTFTIIGTPNYMAPEVLAGKGYNYSVDFWSLGVVLYEFIAGYVPFGQDIEDPYQIYQEILKKNVEFPPHMKDNNFNALIKQLLDKRPEARLGGSYSNMKQHPFFQGLEWNALMGKKVEAPFKLPKESLCDTSKLMREAKPISKVLKVTSKPVTRKGLDPKWDEQF